MNKEQLQFNARFPALISTFLSVFKNCVWESRINQLILLD